jgi:hypothetical protein
VRMGDGLTWQEIVASGGTLVLATLCLRVLRTKYSRFCFI